MREPGRLAVIKTADCIPLSFWEESSRIGGLIHVGWRGLLKGIESKLINLLKNIQVEYSKLAFFIGPSIEGPCYPVGKEVYEQFNNHPYQSQMFQRTRQGILNLDLKKGIKLTLTDSGIEPRRIYDSEICNLCEAQRFPSYRREGGVTHRIYNFLIFK
jgi:YfiH family protein